MPATFWLKTASIEPHLAFFVHFAGGWNPGPRAVHILSSLVIAALHARRDGAFEWIPVWISVRHGGIVDDLSDIRIVDRGAIDLDHLGHFGLQKILPELFAPRLVLT
jgi:hypothetical protein